MAVEPSKRIAQCENPVFVLVRTCEETECSGAGGGSPDHGVCVLDQGSVAGLESSVALDCCDHALRIRREDACALRIEAPPAKATMPGPTDGTNRVGPWRAEATAPDSFTVGPNGPKPAPRRFTDRTYGAKPAKRDPVTAITIHRTRKSDPRLAVLAHRWSGASRSTDPTATGLIRNANPEVVRVSPP